MKNILIVGVVFFSVHLLYAGDDETAAAAGFLEGFNQAYTPFMKMKYQHNLEMQRIQQEHDYQLKTMQEQYRLGEEQDSQIKKIAQKYYDQGYEKGINSILVELANLSDSLDKDRKSKSAYIQDFSLYQREDLKPYHSAFARIFSAGFSQKEYKAIKKTMSEGGKIIFDYSGETPRIRNAKGISRKSTSDVAELAYDCNLFENTSDDSKIVEELQRLENVTILNKNEESGWAKVRSASNNVGFIKLYAIKD